MSSLVKSSNLEIRDASFKNDTQKQLKDKPDIFNTLPVELSKEIFKNLEIADLVSSQRTCIKWKLILRDNILWRNISAEVRGMAKPQTQIPDDYFYQFETFNYKLETLDGSKYNPRFKTKVAAFLLGTLAKKLFAKEEKEKKSYANMAKEIKHSDRQDQILEKSLKKIDPQFLELFHSFHIKLFASFSDEGINDAMKFTGLVYK